MSAAVRVIDGHVHVGPWRTPDFSGRATQLAEAARLYAELGYAGALVMPTDVADNAGLLATLRAQGPSPVAFRFCAWVDPADASLPAFLDDHAADVAALKIHPSFLRQRCTEPVFDPYYRWAAERGVPVLVHCGRWQEMASFRFPLEVAERHPDLNVILCHMGGDGTDLVQGTVAHIEARGIPNAFLGTESVRQYWIVQHAVDRLGPERVLFGSDYNLNHPRSFQAVVDALDVDDAGRRRIFFDNLNGLFPAHLRLGAGDAP